MCTGSFVEEGTTSPWGKLEPIALKGTKCASACKFKGGVWGSSYCKTSTSSEEWGGECVPCSGYIGKLHFIRRNPIFYKYG